MVIFRRYHEADLVAVCSLIQKTYRQFNAQEGSMSAARKYLDKYDLKKNRIEMIKKFARSSIFFVAEENKKIIGIVRGDPNHVSNLFVQANYHGKGIGKILMNRFERQAIRSGSNVIKIHASLYATKFYQSMGYKKTTGIRNWNGLKVQPLKKEL